MYWKWFDKFIASLWLVGVLGFSFLFSLGFNSQVRHAAGIVGVLEQPISKASQIWENNVDRAFSFVNPEAEAQLATTCVNCGLEYIFQATIDAAINRFINNLFTFIMDIFNQLVDLVEDTINALTGLKLNLGSFRAAVAQKVMQFQNTISEGISEWMSSWWQLPEGAERDYNIICANLFLNLDLISYSQKGLARDVTLEGVGLQGQIVKLRQQCALLGAKTMCKDARNIPIYSALAGFYGAGGSCRREVSAILDTQLRDQAFKNIEVYREYLKQFQATCDQAKGVGVINDDQIDSTPPNSGENSFTQDQLNRFDAAIRGNIEVLFEAPFSLENIPPEACEALESKLETLRDSTAVDRSTPRGTPTIITTLGEAFKDLFNQLVNKVITAVTEKIFAVIDSLTGFGSGLFAGVGDAFNVGAKSIVAGALTEIDEELSFDLQEDDNFNPETDQNPSNDP